MNVNLANFYHVGCCTYHSSLEMKCTKWVALKGSRSCFTAVFSAAGNFRVNFTYRYWGVAVCFRVYTSVYKCNHDRDNSSKSLLVDKFLPVNRVYRYIAHPRRFVYLFFYREPTPIIGTFLDFRKNVEGACFSCESRLDLVYQQRAMTSRTVYFHHQPQRNKNPSAQVKERIYAKPDLCYKSTALCSISV